MCVSVCSCHMSTCMSVCLCSADPCGAGAIPESTAAGAVDKHSLP